MTDVETVKSVPVKNEATVGQEAKPENTPADPKPADGGTQQEKPTGQEAVDSEPRKKIRNGSTRSRTDEVVIMERGVKGIIKWFNYKKAFGFIVRDNGDEVFVHVTQIITMKPWVVPCPRKDDEVEFDLVKKTIKGRYEAAAVSGPNGTLVRGRLAGQRERASIKPANVLPSVQTSTAKPAIMVAEAPLPTKPSDKRRRVASDEQLTEMKDNNGAETKPEKKRRAPFRRQFRRKRGPKTTSATEGAGTPENEAKNEQEAPKVPKEPSKQKQQENGTAKSAENGTPSQQVAANA